MSNSGLSYILHRVVAKTCTWARDSHGLYDYESRNVTKNTIKITSSCRLYRQGNEVKLTHEHIKEKLQEDAKYLLTLTCHDGNLHHRQLLALSL